MPTVRIVTPANGSLVSFGDTVPYQITVTDPEDGTVDCGRVRMTYILGHDTHGHQITSQTGCTGSITIPLDGEHDAAANIFAVFDAEYTDNGGLTTHTQHTLQPRHRQAEHFSTQQGVQTFDKAGAEGGRTVGQIENGDWIAFTPYLMNNATSFTARVSSGGAGGTLSLRAGSPTGTLIGSATVPATGSWDTFVNVTGTVSGAPATAGQLYLVFTGGAGALFDVDAFTLDTGSTQPPTGRVEAESYTSQSGVQVVADGTAHGGSRVGYIDGGDWVGYSGVDVSGKTGFTARVASGGTGGTIQVRSGSATGPLLGSVNVGNTGGYGTFVDVTTSLSASSGSLFLVFVGTGSGGLFDVDDFALTGGTTPPATNLALNKTATADSQCASTEGPAKAVNGTVNGGNADKWCSLGASKWWRVDLGATVSVGRVVIRHAGAGGENTAFNTRDFDVQTSTDGNTWTTVSQVRGNTGNVTTSTFTAAGTRYVRVNVIAPTSNADTAARLYEVEVYAS
ncbi:hypothetical protein GCM10027610_088660 [Dactylosporangium cerinum]